MQKRLRPVPEEEVEVTSARERERGGKVSKSKNGQKLCTGNDEIGGRSSPH